MSFQSTAFQISGFQIGLQPTLVLLGGTPAGPNVNPNAADFFSYDLPYHAYRREQDALAERQEAIISMRLEAQDNIIRQRELTSYHNKQSARQIKALERKQIELMAAIRSASIDLEKRELIARNNMAILVLMMAFPCLNITQGSSAIN